MKLITLTRHDGQHIVVNADKIEMLIPYEGCTAVIFDGGHGTDVRETDGEIINKIKKEDAQ